MNNGYSRWTEHVPVIPSHVGATRSSIFLPTLQTVPKEPTLSLSQDTCIFLFNHESNLPDFLEFTGVRVVAPIRSAMCLF